MLCNNCQCFVLSSCLWFYPSCVLVFNHLSDYADWVWEIKLASKHCLMSSIERVIQQLILLQSLLVCVLLWCHHLRLCIIFSPVVITSSDPGFLNSNSIKKKINSAPKLMQHRWWHGLSLPSTYITSLRTLPNDCYKVYSELTH